VGAGEVEPELHGERPPPRAARFGGPGNRIPCFDDDPRGSPSRPPPQRPRSSPPAHPQDAVDPAIEREDVHPPRPWPLVGQPRRVAQRPPRAIDRAARRGYPVRIVLRRPFQRAPDLRRQDRGHDPLLGLDADLPAVLNLEGWGLVREFHREFEALLRQGGGVGRQGRAGGGGAGGASGHSGRARLRVR
ncbi:MAG: hypothetical protein H6R23_1729, partial [Proteobacteria bacterium]|nr:hypothetical protein [Pseudomonadota bacterium]